MKKTLGSGKHIYVSIIHSSFGHTRSQAQPLEWPVTLSTVGVNFRCFLFYLYLSCPLTLYIHTPPPMLTFNPNVPTADWSKISPCVHALSSGHMTSTSFFHLSSIRD